MVSSYQNARYFPETEQYPLTCDGLQALLENGSGLKTIVPL